MRHSCRGLLVLGMVAISGCSLLRPRPTTLGQTPVIQTAPVPAAAPLQTDLVPPPSWIYNDIACASFLTTQPSSTIRVVGSQDAVVKHLMATGDMLVIGGGANDGIQPGQRFFVRRFIRTFGATKGPDPLHPLSVHTSGWVQILGVDATVSTATVLHACEGILLDDYLEPFTEPMIAAHAVPGSTPQYTNMGHILTSDETFANVGDAPPARREQLLHAHRMHRRRRMRGLPSRISARRFVPGDIDQILHRKPQPAQRPLTGRRQLKRLDKRAALLDCDRSGRRSIVTICGGHIAKE